MTVTRGKRWGSGDAYLCHGLRGINNLRMLQVDLETHKRMAHIVDVVPQHDQILDDTMLADIQAVRHTDITDTALSLCIMELRRALSSMKSAHDHVRGLFQGELRDASEEALSRTIKVTERQLEKLEELAKKPEKPRRPYEFRRLAATVLFYAARALVENYQAVVEEAKHEGASADLVERTEAVVASLQHVALRLEKLRERASQKMAAHLQQCLIDLAAAETATTEIEFDAASRAGTMHFYPNLTHLRLAREAAATLQAAQDHEPVAMPI